VNIRYSRFLTLHYDCLCNKQVLRDEAIIDLSALDQRLAQASDIISRCEGQISLLQADLQEHMISLDSAAESIRAVAASGV
jgi:hypothetical protein